MVIVFALEIRPHLTDKLITPAQAVLVLLQRQLGLIIDDAALHQLDLTTAQNQIIFDQRAAHAKIIPNFKSFLAVFRGCQSVHRIREVYPNTFEVLVT